VGASMERDTSIAPGRCEPGASPSIPPAPEPPPASPVTAPGVCRRPVRILLFTDTLADINGVARFLRDMADDARRRHHPLMILTSTRFDVARQPAIRNLPPRLRTPMPGYRMLDLVIPPVARMLALAREFSPDVVHVSTPGPVGLTGRWIARRLGIPFAGTWHTDFPAYVEHLLGSRTLAHAARGYLRWFYAPFNLLLLRSEAALGTLGDPPIYRGPVEVIPPGVCTRTFHPRAPDESLAGRLALAPGAMRVLYVGRVSVEKNLPFLVRVWKEVDARLSPRPVELVVVGDGPYHEPMRRALAGARVKFLGMRTGEELARIYTLCDLFVFPSTTDTLGQVVLEAQASALPAIVSDRGGPASVVRHNETGLVLRADDLPAWVDAVVRLGSDEALRRRLGAAGAERAKSLGVERMFDAFRESHARLVRGPFTGSSTPTRCVRPAEPRPSTSRCGP
jgi:glycosyltransferase involved in cell wall biosynthesis